jgi:DUF971 family protein
MGSLGMSSSAAQPLRPNALGKQGDDGLFIDWSDGHHSVYHWQHLRDECPCASCREERGRPIDPFRILTPAELENRGPIHPVRFEPVGHYAYKIVWSDGHDTGLYTLENLRALCECAACTSAVQK